MSNFVFSPSKGKFFPVSEQASLTDAVPVSDAIYEAYIVPTTRHKPVMGVSGQFSWEPMPQQSPPPLAKDANVLMAGNVTVRSTANATLDGVYSIAPKNLNRILGISAAINAGFGLPARAQTVALSDVSGIDHLWNASEYASLAKGVIEFLTACKAVISGQSTTLPSTTIEIP